MDHYVEVVLHGLISDTVLFHIHSSTQILAQYNHSHPLLATEQLGAQFLRACTSAVVFKQGESVTRPVSPIRPVQGFEPCLIDCIAFTEL